MRIDATHRPWAIATLVVTLISAGAYIPYSIASAHAPSGGSTLGLLYGITGSALMLFAALLGLRKKFPIWRVGRAQTWMRGHLWLGLLTLPLILFHSGFHFGGTLSTTLMVLFLVVLASGIFGAVLQHSLPRAMMERLPMETIYEEIASVRRQLIEEADAILAPVTGRNAEAKAAAAVTEAKSASAGEKAEADAAQPAVAIPDESAAKLSAFYARELRPFLEKPKTWRHPLGDAQKAAGIFRQLRVFLAPAMHTMLEDLADICEEERQLTRQERMHRVLHGWLLLHIPLSYAVLVLTAAHAWMALRY